MGEVYRARDPKLQRDVALKVLPQAVAGDQDRLARFEREAQLLAALNHPNIAGIHGVVEYGGVTALVLELVEGPTLAERLDDGPLPLDEVLSIARQLVDALAAAHDAGIIHRDLKPANIKLRPDGTVKVLDFGLAKANAGSALSGADQTHSPTMAQGGTAAGVILGTAAYMAPEQARGRPVDKRADIWAFGVVVWEMLTGRPLFLGETLSDTLAAVLTREVTWSALPPSTPPALVDLLRHALERDPKKRLRDIGDARLDEAVVAVPGGAASPARGAAWWLLGATAVVALVMGGLIGRRSVLPPAATRAADEVRFTFLVDQARSASVSPDGRSIVVSTSGPLRVRELGGTAMREISGTDGALKPFWSPDSQSIGFGRAGRLWRVNARGGAPVAVCDLPDGFWDHDAGGAWQPDDTIVFTNGGSGLLRVSAKGGDPAPYVATTGSEELHFHGASALPEGRGVLSVLHRSVGADTLELFANGKRTVLLQLPGQTIHDPAYSATGHILFGRTPANEGLWALPFTLETLKVAGEAYLVEPGVGSPSASHTGTTLFLPRTETLVSRLRWLSQDGTPGAPVGEGGEFERSPAISPDGSRVAVCQRLDGAWGITVMDVVRGTRQRILTDGRPADPSWLPDGRSLLYTVARQGAVTPTIRRVSADGLRTDDLSTGTRPVALDDGHYLFDRFKANDFDIFVAPFASPASETPFLEQAVTDVAPRPSPDGRLLAYMSMPTLSRGNPEIMLRRYPLSDEVWQVSSGGGSWPRWSRDGRKLFYITAQGIFEVEVQARDGVELSAPRLLFPYKTPIAATGPDGFDVARDGRFLLFQQVNESAERPVHVVVNWSPRRAPL
jgi:Tol biopolymer transport system component